MAQTQQDNSARNFRTPVVTPKAFDYSSIDVRQDGSKSDVHLLERIEKLEALLTSKEETV